MLEIIDCFKFNGVKNKKIKAKNRHVMIAKAKFKKTQYIIVKAKF